MTKQRLLVYEAVKQNCIHPTATEVYEAIRKTEKISLATVYNSLNYLVDNGYIRRVQIDCEPDRFDGKTEPHFHGICDRCGKIFDFPVSNITEYINDSYNINITKFDFSLHFICSDCENKTK